MMFEDTPYSKPSQKGLIASVIFASIVIGGALIFLGYQLSGSSTNTVTNADVAALLKEVRDLKAGSAAQQPQEPPAVIDISVTYKEVVDNDPVLGKAKAALTLVEFSDYQCPFCRRHFTLTFPQLKKDYIDTGKMKLVFRDFPLPFHNDAIPAATAAQCAREQKGDDIYFKMHSLIFESQGDFQNGTVPIPKENLLNFAAQLNLNRTKFSTCLDSLAFKDEIQQDINYGNQLGIDGTPGFILTNGTTSKRISGAQPYEIFKKEIDAML